MDNPFEKFVTDRIKHFGEESKRLKDKQPLVEYKDLIDNFYFIHQKLGTLEHEVALDKVASEFRLAASESGDAFRRVWKDFKISLARADRIKSSMIDYDSKTAKYLVDLKKSYSELNDDDDKEFKETIKAVIDAEDKATQAAKNFDKGWNKIAWVMLYVNIRTYLMVYVRYGYAKAMFFVFRHSFIFITSILVFGILYSQVSKTGVDYLASIFPQWQWAIPIFAIGAVLFKKYIIDPRVKKLQVKLESNRLRKLAFHLHGVRTMTLVSKTVRRRHPNAL